MKTTIIILVIFLSFSNLIYAQVKISSYKIVDNINEYDSLIAKEMGIEMEDFIIGQIENGIIYGVVEKVNTISSEYIKIESDHPKKIFACRCEWRDEIVSISLPEYKLSINLIDSTFSLKDKNTIISEKIALKGIKKGKEMESGKNKSGMDSRLNLKLQKDKRFLEGTVFQTLRNEPSPKEITLKYEFKCGMVNIVLRVVDD